MGNNIEMSLGSVSNVTIAGPVPQEARRTAIRNTLCFIHRCIQHKLSLIRYVSFGVL